MSMPRSRLISRTAIFVISIGTPTRCRISSALSRRMRNAPVPTVPRPIIPTESFFMSFLAARQPLPPGLLAILGMAEASGNAGFDDSEVKRFQDVIERSDFHGLPRDFAVGDGG